MAGVANVSYAILNGGAAPVSTSSSLVPGQTILAIDVDPTLDSSLYNVPFVLGSMASTANLFGYGRFTRAIGEMQRQGATSILAVAIPSETLYQPLFDYLIDQPFDVVVPVGLAATPSRIQTFCAFALQREQTGCPVMIVMPAVTDTVANMVANAPGQFAFNYPTLNAYPIISARNFVFTVDQVTVNPDIPAEYTVDAAPSLAGLMVNSLPSRSITGRTMIGLELPSPYAADDCLSLSNAGYTVLRQTTRSGVNPYLGVTGTSTDPSAINYSPNYHKISTMRTVQYVVQMIRAQTANDIGGPTANQISTTITNLLADLQTQSIILAYSLAISVQQVAGNVLVSLSILPPYETTYITVSTQLNVAAS